MEVGIRTYDKNFSEIFKAEYWNEQRFSYFKALKSDMGTRIDSDIIWVILAECAV